MIIEVPPPLLRRGATLVAAASCDAGLGTDERRALLGGVGLGALIAVVTAKFGSEIFPLVSRWLVASGGVLVAAVCVAAAWAA